MTTRNKNAHTAGKLQSLDGALVCDKLTEYGNFIIADCERERTQEDDANLRRLALCWNSHDALVAALESLLADHRAMRREHFARKGKTEIQELPIQIHVQSVIDAAKAKGE